MPREKAIDRQARAMRVLRQLAEGYPDAASELDFRTPFELLIATILLLRDSLTARPIQPAGKPFPRAFSCGPYSREGVT